jgi:4-amino-4-deoxy-L-arabinose transferase-like glycosyltransferase
MARGFLLALIVAAALGLRLYHVDSLPPGLYLDEASIGVEAHALATTGRDSTGERFPVQFRALQDWKHPLYVYATAVAERALGPTVLAVRLPAAVFGALTVLLVALLASELSHDRRAGLLAALVLALTPWHVHYSRMAWEAVTLGFTGVLALWLYLVARRRGGTLRFALAGAVFGLALYSYTPAKLLVPVLVVALLAIEWFDHRAGLKRAAWARKQELLAPEPILQLGPRIVTRDPVPPVGRRQALVLLAALVLVGAPFAVFQTRFNAVSIFRGDDPLHAFFHAYVAHLDPGFLFVHGDANARQGWHEDWNRWGELLAFTAPLIALALVRAVRRRQSEDLLLLAWLAIYPLGAALTAEGIPHASRSFLGVPLFAILAAEGALVLLDWIEARGAKILFAVLLAAGLLANAGLALRYYFTAYAHDARAAWTAGVERLIPELVARRGGIRRVHFMPNPDPNHQDVAIVREHVLFFTGFDPGLDPADPEAYFRWDENVVQQGVAGSSKLTWARFLAKLPHDEVLVSWGNSQWGRDPLFKVYDGTGELAFSVVRGFR